MPPVEGCCSLVGVRLLLWGLTIGIFALTLAIINRGTGMTPKSVVSRGRVLVVEAVKKCVRKNGESTNRVKLDVHSDDSPDGGFSGQIHAVNGRRSRTKGAGSWGVRFDAIVKACCIGIGA